MKDHSFELGSNAVERLAVLGNFGGKVVQIAETMIGMKILCLA